MMSDNAKTFKSASSEKALRRLFRDPQVRDEMQNHRIEEWGFNLERAPWWGGVSKGVFERHWGMPD